LLSSLLFMVATDDNLLKGMVGWMAGRRPQFADR
jgi:hypothetical protein